MTSYSAAESHLAVDAVAALDAALARSGASAATRRQRSWALNEAIRHVATAGDRPARKVLVGDLLRSDVVAAWFADAATGHTRVRGDTTDSSDASMRARRASLRALAAHLGLPEPSPQVATVATDPRVSRAEAAAAIRALLSGPPPRMRRASWARTAALAALVVDTAERIGTLYPLTVGALDLGAPTILLAERMAPLSPMTVHAVSIWLDERRELVEQLEGSEPPQLWVSTTMVSVGRGAAARRRPAGLPLTLRGLHMSHRRALERLVTAGRPAELLRLGQLRPGA